MHTQTEIVTGGALPELDSILYITNAEPSTTPTFTAIGGWFNWTKDAGAGLIPQWIAYSPIDILLHGGYGSASPSDWKTLSVSVSMDAVYATFDGAQTSATVGSNVYEVFAPSISLAAESTEASPAHLIVIRESVARHARRVFTCFPSNSTDYGTVTATRRQPVADPDERTNLRDAVLQAVRDISQWLLLSTDDVAEIARYAPANLSNWQSGRVPHVGTVRRLLNIHALVQSLRAALGGGDALLWLQAPSARRVSRLDLLADETGPAHVLAEAAHILFPAPPSLPIIRPDFEEAEQTLQFAEPYEETLESSPPRRVRRPPVVAGEPTSSD